MRKVKITEHLFQISGVQYGTNSNIYAIQTEEGLGPDRLWISGGTVEEDA